MVGGKFTSHEIITGLRDMNFYYVPAKGYIPTYTRTNFIDALHEAFGFRTDYQIVSLKQMKKIFKDTEKEKILRTFKSLKNSEMPYLQGISESFCSTTVKDEYITLFPTLQQLFLYYFISTNHSLLKIWLIGFYL